MSTVAHFFVSASGSKFHERMAHFFIDIYTGGIPNAQMTELADVLDLGSSTAKRAGSNPVLGTNAGIAQLEEQRLCKSKVVGSSPATGSNLKKRG